MTVRTVTLSPGFDHDVVVDHLEAGEVGSVLSWHSHAAGKGLNVSRTLHDLGVDTVAYSLVGERDVDRFVGLAGDEGVEVRAVGAPGVTRDNLTLRLGSAGSRAGHADGARLADVPEQAVLKLFQMVIDDVEPRDVVTMSGSLPTGFRASAWADLAVAVRTRGAVVIADAQGEALVQLLRTGFVHAAKPNLAEAAVLLKTASGKEPREQAADAARRMADCGVVDAIVSLGQSGVLWARSGALWSAQSPVTNPRIEVGAGDAFVAGYAAALDDPTFQVDPVLVGMAVAAAHVEGLAGSELRRGTLKRASEIKVSTA